MRKTIATTLASFVLVLSFAPAPAHADTLPCPTSDPCTPMTIEEAYPGLVTALDQCTANEHEWIAAWDQATARMERQSLRIGHLRFKLQQKTDEVHRLRAEIRRLRAHH
jgi:hypothetical protein